jgi:hypothetical protein
MYHITDMPPPKHRQNQLLQPLNEIFGTKANVRLLRVLAVRRTSFTAGELAKRAVLGRTSIYPALRVLERAGVVEFIGAGSQRLVQLRGRHPLSRIIRELFHAEAHRFEALIVALRGLLSNPPHRPMSAWIDEPAENAESVDTLKLYVVARPEDLESLTDYLNTHLADVERKYDVHIAVHGLTRSELQRFQSRPVATLGTVVLLAGVPPVALIDRARSDSTSTLASHDEHDARSRKLALAIAAKIRRDPGLITIAEDLVKRRARIASPGERRELTEWIRILSTMSPARLQRFLLDDSERAVRLRQTLPALNLLSPAEREAVVKSQTDADVIAAVTPR